MPKVSIGDCALYYEAHGSGEPLLAGLDLPALGYEMVDYLPSTRAAHMLLRKAEDR